MFFILFLLLMRYLSSLFRQTYREHAETGPGSGGEPRLKHLSIPENVRLPDTAEELVGAEWERLRKKSEID